MSKFTRAGLATVGVSVFALATVFAVPAFALPGDDPSCQENPGKTCTQTPPSVIPVVPVVPVAPVTPPLTCPPGTNGLCVVGPVGLKVKTDNGVLAGIRVGDLLCVRVEALSTNTTADAKVAIPCPVDYVPVFKNCDQARAAGASDIPMGSPLYRKRLDANHNGIACETDESTPVVMPAPTPQIVTSHLPVTH